MRDKIKSDFLLFDFTFKVRPLKNRIFSDIVGSFIEEREYLDTQAGVYKNSAPPPER